VANTAVDLDLLAEAGRGPLSRLFRPLFSLMLHSCQMAPLGLLFGLGVDTATEVPLLGLAGAQAAHCFLRDYSGVVPRCSRGPVTHRMGEKGGDDGGVEARAYEWHS